jgi:hypothetical protein
VATSKSIPIAADSSNGATGTLGHRLCYTTLIGSLRDKLTVAKLLTKYPAICESTALALHRIFS